MSKYQDAEIIRIKVEVYREELICTKSIETPEGFVICLGKMEQSGDVYSVIGESTTHHYRYRCTNCGREMIVENDRFPRTIYKTP